MEMVGEKMPCPSALPGHQGVSSLQALTETKRKKRVFASVAGFSSSKKSASVAPRSCGAEKSADPSAARRARRRQEPTLAGQFQDHLEVGTIRMAWTLGGGWAAADMNADCHAAMVSNFVREHPERKNRPGPERRRRWKRSA